MPGYSWLESKRFSWEVFLEFAREELSEQLTRKTWLLCSNIIKVQVGWHSCTFQVPDVGPEHLDIIRYSRFNEVGVIAVAFIC